MEEDTVSVPRFVTLKGATGKVRIETLNGIDYTVVPVVALLEGVIHPVNAPTPEFVTAELFTPSLTAWNGRPLFAGHPLKDGQPISGNSPEVLATAMGKVFNASQTGKALAMEAWLDPKLIKEGTSEHKVLTAVTADPPQMVEVSVGVFVNASSESGTYGTKSYKSKWLSMTPDHLAMLISTPGACSIEMGCGAPRVAAASAHAEHTMTLNDDQTEYLEVLGGPGSGNFGHGGRPGERGGSEPSAGAHESAATSHAAASKAHAAAASAIRKGGDASIEIDHAHARTREASKSTKTSATKPYNAEAAASYGKLAKLALTPQGGNNREQAASMHEQAAIAHAGASKWHTAAKDWAPGGDKFNKATAPKFGLTKETMAKNYEIMHGKKPKGLAGKVLELLAESMPSLRDAMPADMSNRDMEDEIRDALKAKYTNAEWIDIVEWYDDRVIFRAYPKSTGALAVSSPSYDEAMMQDYEHEVTDTTCKVILTGEPTKVEQVRTWETVDSESRWNSQNEELKAACRCGGTEKPNPATPAKGESDMKREERIAALAANPLSPVKNVKALEAMTDEELTGLETSTATMKADKDLLAQTQKDLKAAQDALAAPVTEERLPADVVSILSERRTKDAAEKVELVAKLKAAQNTFSEEELNAKAIPELKKLVTLSIPEKVDFSLRGAPRAASASPTGSAQFAPTDGYAAALAAK